VKDLLSQLLLFVFLNPLKNPVILSEAQSAQPKYLQFA
jgi:hypothetical protein